jgi:hypothetical protein
MVVTLRASMLRRMQRGVSGECCGIAGVRLELAQGVVPLNPQEAVFEGMLAGWARQQQSRFLREQATIGRGRRWCVGWPGSRGSTRGSGSRPRRRRSSVTCGPGRDSNGTVELWPLSLFTDPYKALCADEPPLPKSEWNQYAPGEPYPTTICSPPG